MVIVWLGNPPDTPPSTSGTATTTAEQATASGRGVGPSSSQDQRQPSSGNTSMSPSPPRGSNNARTLRSEHTRRTPSQSPARSIARDYDEEPSDPCIVPIGTGEGMYMDFNETQAMFKRGLALMAASMKPKASGEDEG